MVNIQETAVPFLGSVLPQGRIPVPCIPAMNGVDGNALGQPPRDGLRIRHATLVEGFIACNKHQFQRIGILRVPFQLLHGPVNDGAAAFRAAVGFQLEQLLGNLVQVIRERKHLADPGIFGRQPVISVLIQGNPDVGQFAVLARQRHVIDNLPQVRARLVDESGHAAGGIQQKGNLDHGAVILFYSRLVRRGRRSGRSFLLHGNHADLHAAGNGILCGGNGISGFLHPLSLLPFHRTYDDAGAGAVPAHELHGRSRSPGLCNDNYLFFSLNG